MWAGCTGRGPPRTQQMSQQIRVNNDITRIFEQRSGTTLTHFPGSPTPWDDWSERFLEAL